MNQYKSSAELKDMAKEKLTGHYGVAILAILMVKCTSYLISSFITALIPGNGLLSTLFSLLLSSAVAVFVGVFQTGLALFFLNMACGRPCKVDDIFYGMQNQPMRSLTVSFAMTLLNLLCLTPYQIFATLYLNNENTTYLMLMLVSAAIGLLLYVPFSLAISQSYYLLLDFPSYSGKDALRASFKLMKNHIGRLFYIQVSFIPLQLLAVLTCGIGMLWLVPYMNMTYALFFLDIMNPKKAESH